MKFHFVTTIRAHSDVIRCLAFCNTRLWSAGYDKAIRSFDPDRLSEPATQRDACHTAAICNITVDMEFNHVVTGGFDGAVKTWSTDGKPIDTVVLADAIQALCYVGASGHIWATGTNHKIVVYDQRTGTDMTPYLSETAGLVEHDVQLLHSPAPDLVLGVTPWRNVVVWSFKQSAALYMVKPHAQTVEYLTTVKRPRDPNSIVFTAGTDGTLKRWQPSSDAQSASFECHETRQAHQGSILAVVYHYEMDFICTAGEDRAIRRGAGRVSCRAACVWAS